VETPHRWRIHKTSRIFRWYGARKELVAEVEWHGSPGHHTSRLPDVRFVKMEGVDSSSGGEWFKRDKRLLKKMISNYVKASDGVEYQWLSSMTPEMFVKRADSEVDSGEKKEREAVVVYKHANVFKGRKPCLMVKESAREILDEIVVSFVIVEYIRRTKG